MNEGPTVFFLAGTSLLRPFMNAFTTLLGRDAEREELIRERYAVGLVRKTFLISGCIIGGISLIVCLLNEPWKDSVPISKAQILFDGEEAQEIYAVSKESAEDLKELMENVNQSSQTNSRIRQIVLEEAVYYFNGDKSLEAATDSMQSRVRLYVSERIS